MLRLANLGMKRYDMHRRNARGGHTMKVMHTSCTHTRGQKDQKNSANKLGEKDNHQ